MSTTNASYNGRRSSSNRRIIESTPMEGDTSLITSNNGGSVSGSNPEAVKLYEAIIFSGPIVFTLIIIFLFYFFYLRRHSVDWSSLRMRASNSAAVAAAASDAVVVVELGLKKEFREMLPIIVFKESFSVRDTQCSVCLGEYQAEDKLQQIPGCGHTFHLYCIDLWLATHTTCPLCRLSLISSSKTPPASESESNDQTDSSRSEDSENVDDTLRLSRVQVL
ncbi:RING-H2 finger protein ATL7-like [Chenopodium quinoa]|uniref:RING-type E3 ubiquitin transferase n=1 Tax=Chenopodium quinoa TaxID=63459 RepID=A0A803N0R1_CHEQI|nr:RING-H2 finger protein ATL7-like [Chenopodium quinoa]